MRSSFDTTINVLDGLLGFERATGGSAQVRTALRGGEEYLLERGALGVPLSTLFFTVDLADRDAMQV